MEPFTCTRKQKIIFNIPNTSLQLHLQKLIEHHHLFSATQVLKQE